MLDIVCNELVSAKAVTPNLTFGCELEWSDIDRRIDIPADLGSWEGPKVAGYYMGSEIDIVNTQGRWRGHATDPLCIMCPVGGEIHTVPSYTIESQFFRIMKLMELFPKLGVACPNHGHIHVGVPGLKTDLNLLKKFFRYLKVNETSIIEACCGYTAKDVDYINSVNSLPEWAKLYFLVGDGKRISEDLYSSIEACETLAEARDCLEHINCVDWVPFLDETIPTENSHRTAVNMFNLTKGNTIEFRIFRASLNPVEIWSTLLFTREVVYEAYKGEEGTSVSELLKTFQFQFPKLNFDLELASNWVGTRMNKGRCGPFKKSFSSADIILEDPITEEGHQCSEFEKGLVSILDICKNFSNGNTLDELREQVISGDDIKLNCDSTNGSCISRSS